MFITEVLLSVNHKDFDEIDQKYQKFLVFSLNLLELRVTQKTFTLECVVRLGAVNMNHHRQGFRVINLIETPDVKPIAHYESTPTNQDYLFTIRYCNVSTYLS